MSNSMQMVTKMLFFLHKTAGLTVTIINRNSQLVLFNFILHLQFLFSITIFFISINCLWTVFLLLTVTVCFSISFSFLLLFFLLWTLCRRFFVLFLWRLWSWSLFFFRLRAWLRLAWLGAWSWTWGGMVALLWRFWTWLGVAAWTWMTSVTIRKNLFLFHTQCFGPQF